MGQPSQFACSDLIQLVKLQLDAFQKTCLLLFFLGIPNHASTRHPLSRNFCVQACIRGFSFVFFGILPQKGCLIPDFL